MPAIKPRSSRRVPPPKESDFDHEIKLVDHSAPVPRTVSPEDEVLRPYASESSAAGPSNGNGSLPTGTRPPGAGTDEQVYTVVNDGQHILEQQGGQGGGSSKSENGEFTH